MLISKNNQTFEDSPFRKIFGKSVGTLAVFYIGLHAYFDNKIIMREMKNTNEAQDLKFLTPKHQKKSFDNISRNSLVRVLSRNLEKGFECV